MDIDEIKRRVRQGNYLVRPHAYLHGMKEGFTDGDMVEAVLAGREVESYPDRERMLICGPTALSQKSTIYLHVLCEYSHPVMVEFVTAYIPDELEWESPPYRRRR